MKKSTLKRVSAVSAEGGGNHRIIVSQNTETAIQVVKAGVAELVDAQDLKVYHSTFSAPNKSAHLRSQSGFSAIQPLGPIPPVLGCFGPPCQPHVSQQEGSFNG